MLITNKPVQGILSKEPQSISNTTENTGVSEEFPLLVSSTIQQDNIPISTQTNEYDRKDKMCTKVMDDTTLRIYFPKATNEDRPSLKSATIHTTPEKLIAAKDNDKTINIQGQNLLLIILSP